jgi:hypothetical protein
VCRDIGQLFATGLKEWESRAILKSSNENIQTFLGAVFEHDE